MKNICKDILMIMAGAFLIAASVEFFVIPNHLGTAAPWESLSFYIIFSIYLQVLRLWL